MDQDTQTPALPAADPAPVSPVAVADAAADGKKSGGREFLLIALAVAGGGLITYALLMGRAVPATHAAPPGVVHAAPEVRRTSAVKPREWSAARRELWIGERRKGIAFDVDANEPVGAWMKTVKPILVVRCMGGTTEAFVVTDTAAQIEAKSEAHTVRLRFDDQPPSSERWPDSEEHDALFAPDGAALAARLATAQRFEFGFTPHNAAPVVARFSVAGLAPLLEPAAKHCGTQTVR